MSIMIPNLVAGRQKTRKKFAGRAGQSDNDFGFIKLSGMNDISVLVLSSNTLKERERGEEREKEEEAKKGSEREIGVKCYAMKDDSSSSVHEFNIIDTSSYATFLPIAVLHPTCLPISFCSLIFPSLPLRSFTSCLSPPPLVCLSIHHLFIRLLT
ncbi:hypothetical protein DINM_005612 [Dirofilaria immitis]|nr:hypothetical protein [Dirofilaria immitis]